MTIVLLFCDVWFIWVCTMKELIGDYHYNIEFVEIKKAWSLRFIIQLSQALRRPQKIENLHKATPDWVQSI
jgi:hypothetical protein